MSVPLTEATVQEIQLELIRRAEHEALRGEQLAEALMAHRGLWDAALLDHLGLSEPGPLPGAGLIKLRDLPYDFWNVDTLYILCPDAASAHKLARIAEAEDWGGMVQVHDDPEEVARALGSSRGSPAIVTVWWD